VTTAGDSTGERSPLTKDRNYDGGDFHRSAPLYQVDDRRLCYVDFVRALGDVGIRPGDVLFVHSDISVFGKLATANTEFLLGSLVRALKETVGPDGTIIMPTFTYSFCKGETYDPARTRSTVGALTEYFRNCPGVRRTIQPIFSVAIWGRRTDEFLDVGKDAFDENSIFGKLHRCRGKILIFGSPFARSCTFLHYIEQAHGVPYRYIKSFRGKIRCGRSEYDDEYTFFVRYLDRDVVLDTSRLETYLLRKGLMNQVALGAGKILSVGSEVLFREGWKLLDQDVYFFLEKPPAYSGKADSTGCHSREGGNL